ncbi:Flagellar biosynthesis protein FlhF [Aliarcobacter thereius]|uniref:Flagellar biosynthesis protein FlhF n=2 Tax=Aliarcobacter thereius TaxID=544718 RepID=A0A1C0B949_9BACT|nr:flagellar biosynthesis protein FlhF [Aliarcobacter thereius]OCL88740.1 Flagellar biosynthesis protein FlhF [Aliarcobacter thereius]OCL92235.1 Flagellar biosynthesis protein FlhF [Aliarcobacter thereius]OCL94669.1 Flagellar biosynthesis protein FlhF [Aliarcobacter thereius LMG 24486]OCM00115.1 Flagellar biosynthesis protein FlhF [Aliarcobacter thereius]QBF15455.1 polar flagellar biogenesis protein FlhF [Aliarcobacter thereius LMG 24486]
MKKYSFLGETPAEALREAQKQCGEDAIVISTKKVAGKTAYDKGMYEVVVMVEDDELAKNKEFTKVAITKASSEDKSPIVAQVYDYKEEILKMQSLLEQVQKTLWNPKSQLFDLTIPPEFIDIYTIFEKNEFDSEMTYSIMKKTIKELPVSLKVNYKKVNDFFRLILRKVIPIKMEVPLRKEQRKIIMMVGPTGVGKTTTISKLAARFAYKMEQNYKVGIITLDTFRVGAIEQLQAYTNIMRIPFEVVKRPEDLSEALFRLKNCSYIFIDTAGSSQYDIDKIELVNEYRKQVNDLPIEKTLVLPSNVKSSDLLEIYKNYSILDIDNLIFTKLDETRSFGNIITFAHKTKKPITYFSIGQNVPDDLMAADSSFLIDCFMNQSINRS